MAVDELRRGLNGAGPGLPNKTLTLVVPYPLVARPTRHRAGWDPAGTYKGASSTETEKTLSFALAAGETKYVRTAPSFGVLVGRINLELEDPQKAQTEIETLSFTGGPELAKK